MVSRVVKMNRTRSGSGDLISYYSENKDNALITAASSTDLLKLEIEKPITRPRYRFCWLNEDETVREILPDEDIVLGGSYQENYQNGQRRSISITLFNETGKYTPSITPI